MRAGEGGKSGIGYAVDASVMELLKGPGVPPPDRGPVARSELEFGAETQVFLGKVGIPCGRTVT